MNVEVLYFFQWWVMLLVLGMISLPLSAYFFSFFTDKGYAFSKIIGVIVISYLAFIAGTAKILPFSIYSLIFLCLLFTGGSLFCIKKRHRNILDHIKLFFKKNWRIFVLEELFFLIILIFFSIVRSLAPEINGLEKYMDFGFVNSILRSTYFPPKDMWFTPLSINYYYFGHLITAVLTKLSLVPSNYSYNLMIATLAALCFVESFSLGANIYRQISAKVKSLKYILVGLLCAFLVTFSGNLHTIYSFYKPYDVEKPVPFWELKGGPLYLVKNEQPKDPSRAEHIEHLKVLPLIATFPNSYWYPNATRFIHNTIHEFPIYSWTVSDLHGHALDIPIVILTIALLYVIFLSPRAVVRKIKKISLLKKTFNFFLPYLPSQPILFLGLGFLLAIMYTTNAWDGLIYLLFASLVILYKQKAIFFARKSLFERVFTLFEFTLIPISILGIIFFLVSMPFSLTFKPFVSGVGVLCAPQFLINIGRLGPFLFEADHCLRSPIWQLGILYGFFIFFIMSFAVFLKKTKNITPPDIFIVLIVILSLILIIIPEFLYAKDIYPAHYRANTMFKLVFESFIMLSIASGYIISRISQSLKAKRSPVKNVLSFLYLTLSTALLTIVFLYPYLALTSFYGNIFSPKYLSEKNKTLDGTKYLKDRYPDDYQGILWLQKNIKGQPIILEAQGDSYTEYGRVSVNTGLPTLLGWTVHEWLWRGSYDIPSPRVTEVKTLYETNDLSEFKDLTHKYDIKYIFVGTLEREKYVVSEALIKQMGTVVYQQNETRIYRL